MSRVLPPCCAAVALASALGALGPWVPAHAFAQAPFRPAILVGQPVPGFPGATFTSTNNQTGFAINGNGNIAICGFVRGGEFGSAGTPVLAATGESGIRIIARNGSEFGFTSVTPNINDSGMVIFDTGRGIFAERNGLFEAVAAQNAPIPNLPGSTLSQINGSVPMRRGAAMLTAGGGIAFLSVIGNPPDGISSQGVFTGNLNEFRLLRRTLPDPSESFVSFSLPVINQSGTLAFNGSFRSANATARGGVFTISPSGEVTTIALNGNQAPGLPAGVTFVITVTPDWNRTGINASGAVVFGATLTGPGVTSSTDGSIWISDSRGLRMLAREGDAVPGTSNFVFQRLFDGDWRWNPVISDSGHVLIVSTVTAVPPLGPFPTSAVLFGPDGRGRELLRTGQPAPGGPVNTGVSSFGPLNQGSVAELSPRGQALIFDTRAVYATDGEGIVREVCRPLVGQRVRLTDGRRGVLESVSFGTGSPTPTGGSDGRARVINNRGEIAIQASIDGISPNRQGMFIVRLPTLCERTDVDANGTVDFFDYLDFIQRYTLGGLNADFDGNRVVDFFDYLDFVAAFGECS
jgi:hypothetical protein